MSLKNSIIEEVKRTPLAAVSGLASAVIAVFSLLFAWAQSGASGGALSTSMGTASGYGGDFSLRGVALVVAYFISVTVAASLLLRAVARKHGVAAFFASIPLLALTNFSAILIIYLTPPRTLSPQLFASAHDLVFYASAAIVIAFCGKEVLADLANPQPKKSADENSTESAGDGFAILFAAVIVLAIWSGLVFAGQSRLTRTLLPEITHPVDKTPAPQASQ